MSVISTTLRHYTLPHIGTISMLVSYGADVNSRGRDSIAPLHLAVLNGDVEVVKYLLKADAKAYTCFRLTKNRTTAVREGVSYQHTLVESVTAHGVTPLT